MFEQIDEPRLKALQERVSSLEQERAEAEVKAGQLRVQVRDAAAADIAAEAKAHLLGKKPPKPTKPELEVQLAAAQRKVEVVNGALGLAQGELSQHIANHHQEIYERLLEAERREAAAVSASARQLLADLGRLWRVGEDAKKLRPYRQVPHDENAPAQRLSTTVVGPMTMHSDGAPQRGDVERVLSYYASLADETGDATDAA
jgi:hypothetical protein